MDHFFGSPLGLQTWKIFKMSGLTSFEKCYLKKKIVRSPYNILVVNLTELHFFFLQVKKRRWKNKRNKVIYFKKKWYDIQ